MADLEDKKKNTQKSEAQEKAAAIVADIEKIQQKIKTA